MANILLQPIANRLDCTRVAKSGGLPQPVVDTLHKGLLTEGSAASKYNGGKLWFYPRISNKMDIVPGDRNSRFFKI